MRAGLIVPTLQKIVGTIFVVILQTIRVGSWVGMFGTSLGLQRRAQKDSGKIRSMFRKIRISKTNCSCQPRRLALRISTCVENCAYDGRPAIKPLNFQIKNRKHFPDPL